MSPSSTTYELVDLKRAVKRLLERPPKKIRLFLSAPVPQTRVGGLYRYPAGGQKNGWWTNGRDLFYKDLVIASRSPESEDLWVLFPFAVAFRRWSWCSDRNVRPCAEHLYRIVDTFNSDTRSDPIAAVWAQA